MVTSVYWAAQGRLDALSNFPPKSKAFFYAAQIGQFWDAYIAAYRTAKAGA